MRIISGIYKSRILISPSSDKVRPTSDRAKETLFNILAARFDFKDIVSLDLFCGTGSLGLESVSRGARLCCFVDKDICLVQKNIDQLGVNDKCKIFKMEALNFLNGSHSGRYDLTFCDPPYNYEYYDELIERISELKTYLILEHSGKFRAGVNFEKYVKLRRKTGTVHFTFFDFNI